MQTLALHEFHASRGARFTAIRDCEVVGDYGEGCLVAEYEALRSCVGMVDLSSRSRLVLLGADRRALLNGQVTNNVRDLGSWAGCYAALVNAKARVLSDVYIYALPDELLLDFEPGMTAVVAARLERFVVAQDVQWVDAAPHYGLLSLAGPAVWEAMKAAGMGDIAAGAPMAIRAWKHPEWGDLYLATQDRMGATGIDVFVPTAAMERVARHLEGAVAAVGGRWCGWDALEAVRVGNGMPRFGADIDESNLAPEAMGEPRGISYNKGCYSGQEVIARIRTYGQVAKSLRRLGFQGLEVPPARGARLYREGREAGYVTSAVSLPVAGGALVGLGYVRRESNAAGTELRVGEPGGAAVARVLG